MTEQLSNAINAITTGSVDPITEAKRQLEATGWLPKAQVRILAALNRARGPLTKTDLAERAEVPESHVVGFTLKQYASKATPALVELGFVTAKEVDDDGHMIRLFAITPAGREALARARKG